MSMPKLKSQNLNLSGEQRKAVRRFYIRPAVPPMPFPGAEFVEGKNENDMGPIHVYVGLGFDNDTEENYMEIFQTHANATLNMEAWSQERDGHDLQVGVYEKVLHD
eukprot:g7760.t1